MKTEEDFIRNLKYADVTRAISRNFHRVFCVNTDTNVFVEFFPHENDESLDIITMGSDFRKIIQHIIGSTYSLDLDRVRNAITKENILKVLTIDEYFLLDYRVLVNDKPTYVKLKATRVRKDDPSHVLFALGENDAHMQRLATYEKDMKNSLTYSAISEALAADYVCTYYVDTETGEFIEYNSNELYKTYQFPASGPDFFETCRTDFLEIIYEEDRDIYLEAFDKENLMKVLSVDRLFQLNYRVLFQGEPIHIRMKATKMIDDDDHHIVFGVSNINASVKRMEKYEHMKQIANRDPLTGVKSKHAYTVSEERINREIEQGKRAPFAVAVCDINGLKKINDTMGHQAGDEYIRRSCQMICELFSHSPIYRIGGDEFVVLLRNRDYENRKELLHELHNLSVAHIGTNEAVVSGGMSEYNPEEDHCLQDIFERADALMYEEKKLLKSQGAVVRDEEKNASDSDHENIPFINMRKHILIADDLESNRAMLGNLLEDDYDILYAADGIETLEMLRKHKDEIALLLLDLYMPNMTGREVIQAMRIDEELMSIPVIMLTVDRNAELDSLKLGAMDFISKPYPDINIVKARIAKCIELSENRDLIRHTERDRLTGLFNFDYFMQYADRFEHQHKGSALDAFVFNINHFHDINEKYGRQFGDHVLHDMGSSIRKLARKTGGIGCRQDGDTFILYCPHQDNYEQVIERFNTDLFVDKDTADKVSLRFGVFSNAQREPDIEKRFLFAKSAADGMRDNPGIVCGCVNGCVNGDSPF